MITNDRPIIGPYYVNKEGSNDMYGKGRTIIHMIRRLLNNDEKFRAVLRKLNSEFQYKVASSKDIEAFLIRETGIDLSKFFDQYLRSTSIPTLEYAILNNTLKFRFMDCNQGFSMRIPVSINGQPRIWITPTTEWKQIDWLSNNSFEKLVSLEVDRGFYVKSVRTVVQN